MKYNTVLVSITDFENNKNQTSNQKSISFTTAAQKNISESGSEDMMDSDVIFETSKNNGNLSVNEASSKLLQKPFVLRRQNASGFNPEKSDSVSHVSTVKSKKSNSLRSVSGNFIKAILSTRDKAHSCPPVPSGGANNEHVGFTQTR